MSFTDLLLVLGSAFVHAGWSATIKGSRDPLTFNLLQLATPIALLALALPWIDLSQVPPTAWKFLAATTIAHGGYFYWMSRAFEHGDLTLVYPIARSTPAFLPILAVPLLGDAISPVGAVGIAVVVAGIWLLHVGEGLRLSGFAERGARYAYLTLAATVAYSLCDKGAMTSLAEAPWSSPVPRALFYCLAISCTSALVFAPLALRRRRLGTIFESARREGLRATAASLASLAGYSLILLALQTASVSYVVAVRQTSVLFALLLGVFWLRERPGRPRLLGAAATVLGVALIAFDGDVG